MYNLKVNNCIVFSDFLEDLSWEAAFKVSSEVPFQRCKAVVRDR